MANYKENIADVEIPFGTSHVIKGDETLIMITSSVLGSTSTTAFIRVNTNTTYQVPSGKTLQIHLLYVFALAVQSNCQIFQATTSLGTTVPKILYSLPGSIDYITIPTDLSIAEDMFVTHKANAAGIQNVIAVGYER